jgi:hypothetical protein
MRRTQTNARDKDKKTPIAIRLTQVRRMVERVEAERVQYEDVGLTRLAHEKAREKRYWQFVQAVLELQPWMGQTQGKHTVH